MSEPLLASEGMTSGYDNAAVVRDMDLTVAPGEVVALLGEGGQIEVGREVIGAEGDGAGPAIDAGGEGIVDVVEGTLGGNLRSAFGGMAQAIEGAAGVASAPAVTALAQRLGVEMPICAAVAAILDGSVDVTAAVSGLLSRPLRTEA